MDDVNYNKGSFCRYSQIFCQEGYCSKCSVPKQSENLNIKLVSGSTAIPNTRIEDRELQFVGYLN
jgi:hypothetical protein